MNLFAEIVLWITYILSLYFSIFFLLIFLEKKSFFKQENKQKVKLKNFPFVSVLIPAYNEEKTIIGTLQSVTELDYPKEKLEIIAINDGSTDHTEKNIKKFIKNRPSIKLLSHKNMGKAASLNKALALAQGEFFACLDADSFVDSQTLKKMIYLYQQENDSRLAIVTPAMKVKKPKKIIQKIQWIEYLLMILIARLSSQIDSLYVAPGPFSLYRTKIIRKLGGFDEKNLTEDQEIAYRVQQHHYRIKHCFDGYVHTVSPGTIKEFYKQRRRWYQGGLTCLHQYRKIIMAKKYGDFGLIQLTKNFLGFILAFTGLSFGFYFFIMPLFKKFQLLYALNFEVWPFINTLSLKINFHALPFKKIFIFGAFVFITGTFFYLAHKNAQEKISKYGVIHLIPYFAFYYLLKGGILLLSFVQLTIGKKTKW